MPFLTISLVNFRNLSNKPIDLSAPEVFLIGKNGQGKTNLLESLYIASYGNSFRTRTDSEIYTTGTNEYSIRAMYKAEKTDSISIISKNGKKQIEKNLKKIRSRKDLVNTIPCVLFFHNDLDFAVGSPERRRFFIDQSLSMYNPFYLDLLQKYTVLLKTKNKEIKEQKRVLLDSLDVQIASVGFEIISYRKKTIDEFNTIFSDIYEKVSGIDNVRIEYKPSWKHSSAEEVMAHLAARREKDILLGTCMSGPHRDKIHFVRNNELFISTASTGQLRLISLVLRTAQALFFTKITGKLPILLMDDVLLELDPDKRKSFTDLLPKYDQLFCTFLPGEPYKKYAKEKTLIYFVSNGEFHAE
ncbi:DNA replication/repair protein RecF [Treponema phagedenis]|uniref:DNA replication/repair protein RecF n=1 Tax=Treponema phagedenis TaxID=162 RepID=UPI0001F63A39|nr:DNA replication and repair protein RecF [Treponema phagedenis]EFW39073.1 DNA replication and repair protein RecF [Treponema phagedenis F0421]TYT78779.1 DNA replication/repair protein RecF [Treponema phagedenis]